MEKRSIIIPYGLAALSILLIALPSGRLLADQGKGRPKVSVRASPTVAFPPARIVATAEIKDGANDWADFYCAKVEWTWGDGTKSESKDDCDPYEAGKTEIRRIYTAEHKFNDAGVYDVRFSLLQGTKIVGSAMVTVRVRDGEQ
jgi:hypothetical protein